MEHIKKVLQLLMVLGVKWVLSEAQTTGALRWNQLNAAEPEEKQRDSSRGRESEGVQSIRREHTLHRRDMCTHSFHYCKGVCLII